MSEETTNGCINHKDRRHIRLYYDYLDIYNGNEHKAKIVRVLETWTDSKRNDWYKASLDRLDEGESVQEPDFWITMSYQQFRHFMRDTVSIDTIKTNLAEIVKIKHIERRVNPDNPYGPPQYKLNCQAIQKAVNKLPPVPFIPDYLPPGEDTPPMGKTPPPGKDTPPQGVKTPPPPPENTPLGEGGKSATSNNSNTKITINNNDKDISANADSARDISSSEQKDQVTDASKEIVPPENDTHSQLSPPTVDKQASSVDKPEKPKRRRKQRDLTAIEPVPPPEKPAPDALWNVVTCLQLADYYRGHTLTNGSYGMAQNEAISIIQQGCSYAEIDAVFRYMRCVDPDLKDDFWEDKTVDIWNVNKHREAKLKEIKRKTQKSPGKPKLAVVASNGVDYNAAIFDTSRNYIKGSEEELAQLEAQYQALKARKKEAAR